MADGAAAIQAEGLVKRFDEVEAVRGVSFSVPPGQTFGFLGPNGAGKSTTISMLCTLLRPSAGRASVAGYDVVEHKAEVRRRIGLVFQDTTLDDYLTAEENLRFHADAEEYARALEREAERDLARHPERRRYATAASPDEHRRRVRRQPGRSTP